MLFVVYMHKDEPKPGGICPPYLRDLHRQGFVGRRKLNVEGETGPGRK